MRRRWSQEEFAETLSASHARVNSATDPRQPRSYPPPAFETPERRFWPVTPAPAPRQSKSDRWKTGIEARPCVRRYRNYRDAVVRAGVWSPTSGDLVVFLLPMPKSWSQKKRREMDGQPHTAKPDFDNLAKALCDACYADDAHIWTLVPAKVWSAVPGIYIERRAPAIEIPFVEHVELAGEGACR